MRFNPPPHNYPYFFIHMRSSHAGSNNCPADILLPAWTNGLPMALVFMATNRLQAATVEGSIQEVPRW